MATVQTDRESREPRAPSQESFVLKTYTVVWMGVNKLHIDSQVKAVPAFDEGLA